jgi:hypothetical protein
VPLCRSSEEQSTFICQTCSPIYRFPFRLRRHETNGFAKNKQLFAPCTLHVVVCGRMTQLIGLPYDSSPFISSPVISSRSFRPLVISTPVISSPGHLVPWSFRPLLSHQPNQFHMCKIIQFHMINIILKCGMLSLVTFITT